MIVLAVDSASNVTDWLSAWGQIAGAVATFAAVVVALWIAVRDERRIEQNRLDEAHGEAAMAVAEMRRDAVAEITNHSSRPIREPKVIDFEFVGRPDIMWRANEPDLPAGNYLGPGSAANTRGGYWVATGPGASRSFQQSDLTAGSSRPTSRSSSTTPRDGAGPAAASLRRSLPPPARTAHGGTDCFVGSPPIVLAAGRAEAHRSSPIQIL
jgi:hypothetical protein